MANLHKKQKIISAEPQKLDFSCYLFHAPCPPVVESREVDAFEVVLFLTGNVHAVFEERTYELRPGDILLMQSREVLRIDSRPGSLCGCYVIRTPYEVFAEVRGLGADLTACFEDAILRGKRCVRLGSAGVSFFKGVCEKIVAVRQDGRADGEMLAKAYLIEFLVYLNRGYFSTPEPLRQDRIGDEKLDRVAAYITEHLAEPLSLDRLAGQFYVSKYYLNHRFKQATGLTLYQYILKKRLVAARNLLLEGERAMDACFRCGFNDYSNFRKAFKREFGKSPKEYQRRT